MHTYCRHNRQQGGRRTWRDDLQIIRGTGFWGLNGGSLFEAGPTLNASRSDIMQWYALRVRPRFEKIVAKNLQDKGHELFLPCYSAKRQWSDRIKYVELPLFPSYVFCRFSLTDTSVPVLTTPAVREIVGISGRPLSIDPAEIEAVRSIVKSGLEYQSWPYLSVGQFVRVESGALAGLKGLVIAIKDHCRLVVSVNLLMRSVAVEIDRAWIKPIDPDRSNTLSARAFSACG